MNQMQVVKIRNLNFIITILFYLLNCSCNQNTRGGSYELNEINFESETKELFLTGLVNDQYLLEKSIKIGDLKGEKIQSFNVDLLNGKILFRCENKDVFIEFDKNDGSTTSKMKLRSNQ